MVSKATITEAVLPGGSTAWAKSDSARIVRS